VGTICFPLGAQAPWCGLCRCRCVQIYSRFRPLRTLRCDDSISMCAAFCAKTNLLVVGSHSGGACACVLACVPACVLGCVCVCDVSACPVRARARACACAFRDSCMCMHARAPCVFAMLAGIRPHPALHTHAQAAYVVMVSKLPLVHLCAHFPAANSRLPVLLDPVCRVAGFYQRQHTLWCVFVQLPAPPCALLAVSLVASASARLP